MQTFHVIRYQGRTYAAPSLAECLQLANPLIRGLIAHYTAVGDTVERAVSVVESWGGKKIASFWSDSHYVRQLIED